MSFQFFQHALHLLRLFALMRAGDIRDMQQQLGALHFFQRGAKRAHQRVRQIADESHRIGEQDFAPRR